MATLTEISKTSRDLLKFGLFLGAILILLYSGYKIYTSRPKPAPPIIPTVDFDKLPPLSFPAEQQRPSQLILQTIQGSPPEATPIARVYKTQQKTPGLLAGRLAQQFARQLNFSPDPISKSAGEYVFADAEYPARRLTYELASGNFNLEYDLAADPTPLEGDSLPTEEKKAVEEAVTILRSLNKFPPYISEGQSIATYQKWENGQFIHAENKFSAAFVRVDFLPGKIGEFEIKTPQPGKSSVYVILSGRRLEQERIIKISYNIFPPNISAFATYPLKSSAKAWEDLKKGEGYISNLGQGNQTQAYVRDAYLAYYDPGESQDFMQPIFVFTGDRGFEAFVPAVAQEWTK